MSSSIQFNSVAVRVHDAYKSYGHGKHGKVVLSKFNMLVRKGTIYGLLGASGCGKTTLLNCIAGLSRIDSGDMWVLGGRPNTQGCAVPGSAIGYMPQDIALIRELKVKEMIDYFGLLNGMTTSEIARQFQHLTSILELPPGDKFVWQCSGGQQRRVSFAVALLHKPQLLILDEPTVGLDPVLRETVWENLLKLVKELNTAVIITTHYIEEAGQADTIGLMRGGVLLAEESPKTLLQMYQGNTLEAVFLRLSELQSKNQMTNSNNEQQMSDSNLSLASASSTNHVQNDEYGSAFELTERISNDAKPISQTTVKWTHLKALLVKSRTQIVRNKPGLFMTFLIPIVQLMAFLMAIGGDPRNIQVAITNEESSQLACSYSVKASNYTQVIGQGYNSTCEMNHLSCRYLSLIDDEIFVKMYYNKLEDCTQSVNSGRSSVCLHFSSNFSQSFQHRMLEGPDVADVDLITSEISVYIDKTNTQVYHYIYKNLLWDFRDFIKFVLRDCELPDSIGQFPMSIKDPVFGAEDVKFSEFLVPGMLICSLFFGMFALTSSMLIDEQKNGVWSRTLVSGVTMMEILCSQFISTVLVSFLQTLLLYVFTFHLYMINNVGSHWIVLLFLVISGVTGLCFGFCISILSKDHTVAFQITNAFLQPLTLLSGFIWPIEGMPVVLQWISKMLPLTLGTQSLRNVMSRGWDLSKFDVVDGLLVLIAWGVVFLIITLKSLS